MYVLERKICTPSHTSMLQKYSTEYTVDVARRNMSIILKYAKLNYFSFPFRSKSAKKKHLNSCIKKHCNKTVGAYYSTVILIETCYSDDEILHFNYKFLLKKP